MTPITTVHFRLGWSVCTIYLCHLRCQNCVNFLCLVLSVILSSNGAYSSTAIYTISGLCVSDIRVGGSVGTTSPVGACLGRHARPVPGLCEGSPFGTFALCSSPVIHCGDLIWSMVAMVPSVVDGGGVRSILSLWSAQGRALGALVKFWATGGCAWCCV